MPRNGSGQYSLPEAAFVPGTTISSAAVNDDYSDIASALTDSVASDGQTPITGPLLFPDGSAAAPPIAFSTNTNDGFHHSGASIISVALGGIDYFSFNPVGATNGSGLLGSGGAVLCPIGAVFDFTADTIPSGWFLCYGQAISRVTYSELFGVIGVLYGAGDGSSTYNLPDCRGRLAAGRDNMGGVQAGRLTGVSITPSATNVGGVGGVQAVTLVQGELPAVAPVFTGTPMTAGISGLSELMSSTGSINLSSGAFAFSSNPFHGPSQTNTFTPAGSIANLGSSQPHLNVQPTIIFNKIIFAGHP